MSKPKSTRWDALNAYVGQLDASRPPLPDGSDAMASLEYLAGLSVVNRLDDVFALLRAGTGATVAGALARSLVEQGVRATWREETADRRLTQSAWLSQERSRLMDLLGRGDVHLPNIARWLRPIGEPSLARGSTGLCPPDLQQGIAGRAKNRVESITGMPASVADFLAMCTHANAAAAMCTVQLAPHPVGFAPTEPFGAIFAHAASAGAAAASANWQAGAHREQSNRLLQAVIAQCRYEHGLPTPGTTTTLENLAQQRSADSPGPFADWLNPPGAVDEVLEQVIAATEKFERLLAQAPNPFASDAAVPINLTGVLPYLTALSTCHAALSACRGTLSGATATTAARMLLEESARFRWMSAAVDDDELMKRYVTIMDAATQGRTVFRQRLLDAGTTPTSVAKLLDTLPASPPLAIDRRRTPAHLRAPRPERPAVQLVQLGSDAAEEHWYEVAYRLLSQVVHATPLGEMHLQARLHGDVRQLSHEMTALSADVACLSTAALVGPLAGLLAHTYGLGDVGAWSGDLYEAAGQVHAIARLVHFLN